MSQGSTREAHATPPNARELVALARERDDLLLLAEALVDVEAARTTDIRLSVMTCAIQRLGYRRVRMVDQWAPPAGAATVTEIGSSLLLDSRELAVPLRAVDGTQLATLILGDSSEDEPFTPSRVRMVELFAQQVASTIENARLYDESQRERLRGEALAGMARALTGSLRLSDVLALGLRHAMDLLGGEAASIGLLRGDKLVLIATAGAAAGESGLEIELENTITGGAIRSCQTMFHNDIAAIAGYRQPSTKLTIERIIVAPLTSGSDPIGTLSVINRAAPFGTDDADVLRRLADQIAVAITNARLYEEARETAEQYRRAVEDERRTRELAAKTEERYSRLVESAADAIFTIDREGLITSANRSLEQACGKRRDELLGTRAIDLVDPHDRAVALRTFDEALTGTSQRAQFRYSGADGGTRSCSVTLTPLHEGERTIGLICIVRDVTDDVRITEQLVQQEKLAAVGELVSGVAHELNNPLASVMAFAQLLLIEGDRVGDKREALEAIHQEAKRAAKIVANLLTFARQQQSERGITDLNRVVENTLELRRYSLRTAQVNVVLQLDPSMPATMADPFQLQQVVLNLLANAEHALDSWTGRREITLSTRHDGDLLSIVVADTGPGIAPDHLSRVFNPFFTTKPVGEGTGLGLSISDGIVRQHGGRIRVESTPGLGATFVVELPQVLPQTAGSSVARDGAAAAAPAAGGKRLLVVDDEPGIRQALTLYFRSRGHHVDAAANGATGMHLAASGDYDAVLLDLRLPDTDGDTVLRELERIGRAPRRVVFATGDPESAAARAVSSAGHPVVGKPFALSELATMLFAPVG